MMSADMCVYGDCHAAMHQVVVAMVLAGHEDAYRRRAFLVGGGCMRRAHMQCGRLRLLVTAHPHGKATPSVPLCWCGAVRDVLAGQSPLMERQTGTYMRQGRVAMPALFVLQFENYQHELQGGHYTASSISLV